MTFRLVRYDVAKRAIADLVSVDEVKDWRDKALAIQAYAVQAKDKQLEVDAAEHRFRCERRLGELLAASDKAKAGRPPENPSLVTRDYRGAPTLAGLGISYDLSSRAQAIATIPEDGFEAELAAHRDEQRAVSGRTMDRLAKRAHVAHNSGNNEWYTPRPLIDAAVDVMGGIDLDPASSEAANRTVGAARFYTVEDDGLTQPWTGRVWMNPPYAQPAIRLFCERLISCVDDGDVSQACVLTNNATDTAWGQVLLAAASAVCFVAGRVRFVDVGGNPSGAPLQGQMVIYIGERRTAFATAFSAHGTVLAACAG